MNDVTYSDIPVQIHHSIVKKYKPQLQDHPAIGKTLSQAELYRTHFTTSLYEPAKVR